MCVCLCVHVRVSAHLCICVCVHVCVCVRQMEQVQIHPRRSTPTPAPPLSIPPPISEFTQTSHLSARLSVPPVPACSCHDPSVCPSPSIHSSILLRIYPAVPDLPCPVVAATTTPQPFLCQLGVLSPLPLGFGTEGEMEKNTAPELTSYHLIKSGKAAIKERGMHAKHCPLFCL